MNEHKTVIQPRKHFARRLILVMAAFMVIALCIISLLFYRINASSMKSKLLDTIQLTDKQIVSQIENRFSQIRNVSDTILYYMYAIPEKMDTDPVRYLDSYALLRKNTSLLQTIFSFNHVIFFLEKGTPFSQEGRHERKICTSVHTVEGGKCRDKKPHRDAADGRHQHDSVGS